MLKQLLLAALVASASAYSNASSPAPASSGAVSCRYDPTNASKTYLTDDADHCCECFHATCGLTTSNCPLGADGTNLFDYFSMQYCALGDLQFVSYVFLFGITFVVFSLLGTTADNFFVTQLETLSESLQLSPSTAAITLLAVGNSAPDVFGDLAAVGGDDYALALGELLGASMFLTTIVLAAVILYATQDGKECTVDKSPIRDILSFASVLAAVFFFASDDKVTSVEAIATIGAYVLYVGCVIWYTKKYGDNDNDLDQVGGGGREKSVSSMSWSRRAIATSMATHPVDGENNRGRRKTTSGLQTRLVDSISTLSLQANYNTGELRDGSLEPLPETQEANVEEELVGVDWDPEASTFDKVTFVIEYPFSVIRWLSIPGADGAWSSRRRLLTHLVPMGSTMIVFLDFSPYWTGGSPWDGFATTPFYVAMLVSFLAGSIMYQCSNDHELPSWNWILVTLAFVATVAWLDLLGNECVAVLESIGTITGLTSTPQGHSVLGVTLLSWANSIGDYIADTAVTKAGKPEMGVSAVFGAPMLTCCLGIGISSLVGSFKTGYVSVILDAELALSFTFMALSLCSSLAVIVKSGYRLPRWYAFYLFGLYAAYMLFSLLTVLNVFDLIPGRAPAAGNEAQTCPKF